MTNHPTNDPRNFELLNESAIKDVVPPMYRIGDDSRNHEVIVGEYRILTWTLSGDEERTAEIAGWNIFDHRFHGNIGYLILPNATRNALSVLSGMEAWEGEKAAIIGAASEYLHKMKEEFGEIDHSFDWSAVGVTPDHEVFVAPPNKDSTNPNLKPEMLKEHLSVVLGFLLVNDDANRHLVDEFSNNIADL